MHLDTRQFLPDSQIENAVQCVVRSITRRKNFGAISEDDLFQEGMIFALEHMDKYCKDEASVMTFLFRPVKSHLNRIIHKEAQSSGLLLPEDEDIEDLADVLPQYGNMIRGEDITQAFSYESDVILQLDIKAILETLSNDEREIVTERFMNGVKLKDLASRFCISEPAMHHRITKIIAKLRFHLGDEYATS